MKHILFIVILIFFVSINTLSAQKHINKDSIVMPLWKHGAPGSESRINEPEIVIGNNVSNVHNPTLTAYFPDKEKSTGTAVIIAPGGGHKRLCLGHEGYSLAKWFSNKGITAFILKYRLSNEKGSIYTLKEHAMDDTRRAIRMVRYHAKEWGVNPNLIGILGFSAGGEVAAYSAMDPHKGNPNATDSLKTVSSRPDFQGLIYPGKSETFTVKEGMPPAFMALGYNDRTDVSLGMANVYIKYKEANVPCELHIYSNAGHGFGFRPTSNSAAGNWVKRFYEWLVDSKLIFVRK